MSEAPAPRRGSGGARLCAAPLRRARASARHDGAQPDTLQGFLRLRYRSAGPVHVGTGMHALESANGRGGAPRAVREAVRIAGAPGVPGATLRGALRARYARLTRSCLGGRGFIDPAAVAREPALGSCRGREACPACALFGMPGLASRVRVRDGRAPEGTAFALVPFPVPRTERGSGSRRTAPRSGEGRAGGRAPSGPPREPVPRWGEVVPADTPIAFELVVRNLESSEIGGLLGALGCEPQSALLCGSRTRSGWGRLDLEGLEVELYDPGGALAEIDVAHWRGAFERSADRWPEGEAALLRELERAGA